MGLANPGSMVCQRDQREGRTSKPWVHGVPPPKGLTNPGSMVCQRDQREGGTSTGSIVCQRDQREGGNSTGSMVCQRDQRGVGIALCPWCAERGWDQQTQQRLATGKEIDLRVGMVGCVSGVGWWGLIGV